jgi:hypothetical protein
MLACGELPGGASPGLGQLRIALNRLPIREVRDRIVTPDRNSSVVLIDGTDFGLREHSSSCERDQE